MPIGAILASIGIGFAGITSAQTASIATTSSAPFGQGMRGMGMKGERPAVVGKVTAISGSTITVADQRPGETASTQYTVDASNAKVLKGGMGTGPTESSVSAIVVGDIVAVRGTISGTSVTATEIMNGVMPHRGPGRGHGTRGTVTAVNGSTITITGDNGTSYTVNAASAHVSKITTISASDIAVGDKLDVMGDVSGSTITAKQIVDSIAQVPQHTQQ